MVQSEAILAWKHLHEGEKDLGTAGRSRWTTCVFSGQSCTLRASYKLASRGTHAHQRNAIGYLRDDNLEIRSQSLLGRVLPRRRIRNPVARGSAREIKEPFKFGQSSSTG